MTEEFKHALQQRTYFNSPKEKVYDAVTSADCWNSFFTTGMEIDLQVGGVICFRWKNWGPDLYSTEVPGTVISCQKPDLFSFEWGRKMKTTVEFHLEEKYGGTILTVKEYGYPNTSEGINNLLECACGWGEAVTLLKFYLEHKVVYGKPMIK